MTTQNTQNTQARLISLFVFSLLLVGAFWWFGNERSGTPNSPKIQFSADFQAVSAKQVHSLFPEAQGKPMLIEFHSKFCLDCKRIKPLLESLYGTYPDVVVRQFDVAKDDKKYPAVFRTFSPTTVPALIFIDRTGSIQTVLYGYYPLPVLEKAFRKIHTKASAA